MGLCVSCSTSSAAENDFEKKKLIDLKSYYNTNVILRLQEDEHEINNNKVNGNVLAVSTAGLLLSVYSQQGSKGLNQDAATIHEGYGAEKDGVFVGVYDGHGMNGHIVSRLIRDRLSNLLLNLKNARGSSDQMMEDNTFESQNNEEDHCTTCSVDECFTNAFKAMDKEIKLLQDVDCCISGSTAVVVVKQGDDLAIANLGDSRAVMVTKTENGMETTQLTTDMKPNLPEEADRIRKLNGRVFALEEESHIQRVWMPEQDYPGLAMTRSFGDFDLKKHGVVSIPKVTLHKLTSRDQFLVLATDGVWDVMSNDQVATAVLGSKTQEEAAKTVVNEARLAWKRRFPSAKVDDCTVACLFFLTS